MFSRLRHIVPDWSDPSEARREQLLALGRQTPLFLVLVLVNALIAGAVSWGYAAPAVDAAWYGAVLLTSAFWLGVRTRFVAAAGRRAGRDRHRATVAQVTGCALAMGVVWGVGAWALYCGSPPPQQQLLTVLTVTTAAVGAVAFSVMPRAVIAFVIPAIIPLFVGTMSGGHLAPSAATATAVVFLFSILAAAWFAFRTFAENVNARLELAENNLVISLLLKDFEDTTSDWLWETDSRLRMTKLSERGEMGIRVSVDSVLGKTVREMSNKNPETDEAWRRHLEHLERHLPFHDYVYESFHDDGSITWISVSGKPRFDSDGNFLGYRGVMSDITAQVEAEAARRRAEQKLRESYEDLERRVDERTKELRESEETLRVAKDAAEAASRAKDNFIANMSHELRTPLNAIIGFSELMAQQTMGPVGQPDYVQFASEIHASGHHLLAIVNDILDLSKSQSGKLRVEMERISLESVVDECLPIVAAQSDRKGIRLETDIHRGLPDIMGDRVRLKQILINLLSNAVKFTEPGGRVSVSAALASPDEAVVRVSDTGIGMSSEEVQIALEPFGQVDNSLSRINHGTGLGLPLTKKLVELHGGTLRVDSTAGAGTTVEVRLPVVRAGGTQAPPATTRETAGQLS